MDLYDTDTWHPGMLDLLVEAHRDRWGTEHELLATIAQGVHLLWRQQVVSGGGEDPGPLEIQRPGQEAKKPVPAWKRMLGLG